MGLGWVVFSIKKWLELTQVFRPLFYFYFLYTSCQKPSPKGKPKLYGPHKQGEVQVLSKGLQSIWIAIHGKACQGKLHIKACQGKLHIKAKVPKYNEAD